jgi:glycosyltransferase involved in cell wall biosynthesis
MSEIPSDRRRPSVAILLSTDAFEDFYGRELGFDRERFLRDYRNDWSWEYAAALQHVGVSPSLYVASHGPSARHEVDEGIGVRFLGMGGIDFPWRRVRLLRRTPPGRYVAQAANAASFLRALRVALRDDGIDVLMVQEYWTARWDLLAETLDVPLVAVDQGLPDRREIKLLKRRTLPRARRVIVQTERERAKVARYGGRAIRIPNGVATERYAPVAGSNHARDREVLVVARLLDVQKRISDLIRALALLDDPWRLRILGDGPDAPMLRELARDEGVLDRCTFEGFVIDRGAIRAAMQRCGVFALPSAYEGLPMALLEAMSCGAAVVGSNIAAIAEVMTDGEDGLLVPVGDPTSLAEGIAAAYGRRAELGAAARRTIERTYAQTVVARQLVEATLA